MEYFGIDEKVLYPSSSFLNDSTIMDSKPKRSLGKLRGSIKEKKDRNKTKAGTYDDTIPANQLRTNSSKKRIERPTTTIIRKEVNAMWNEALKEERNHIREHSPDRVSRITTLSNVQGIGNTKRYQEPQSFGKRTNMNLEFSIPMPYEKKKGTLFRNSNGNRRKIFSKTWWSNVPIGAYLFFFGFLFPPLWFIGAFCQFRKDNTVEAEIQRSKSKKTTNTKNPKPKVRESHVEFSKIEDPENSDSWNWGLGGVGNQPDAINVNFMSGIEEFEKHKLAENEKWWRKVNILMSVLFTIFILGILIIKRKQIFGGDDNSSKPTTNSYGSLNGDFKGNNGNDGEVVNSTPEVNNNPAYDPNDLIPLNNFGRDGNGDEIID